MNHDAIRRARPCPRGGARGYSLVESLIALVIMSVLVSMGIPRFQKSLEQARANVAWANLRAIWSAQRLYWLEKRSYATDLGDLQKWIPMGTNFPVVDSTLPISNAHPNENAPYIYQVSPAGDGSATATCNWPSNWSGSFTIYADGSYSGCVTQSGQSVQIGPSFQ